IFIMFNLNFKYNLKSEYPDLVHARIYLFFPNSDHGEDLYQNLLYASNRALRYMPHYWYQWGSMLTVLELYTKRAVVEFERNDHKLACSNLRHAVAVFRHFQVHSGF